MIKTILIRVIGNQVISFIIFQKKKVEINWIFMSKPSFQ